MSGSDASLVEFTRWQKTSADGTVDGCSPFRSDERCYCTSDERSPDRLPPGIDLALVAEQQVSAAGSVVSATSFRPEASFIRFLGAGVCLDRSPARLTDHEVDDQGLVGLDDATLSEPLIALDRPVQ
jgi:hypothetical protein